jgi:hypothetical protein
MPQLTSRQIQDIGKLVSEVVGSNTDPARLLDMIRRNGPKMLTDKQLEIALAYLQDKTPEQVHDEIAEQVAALLQAPRGGD